MPPPCTSGGPVAAIAGRLQAGRRDILPPLGDELDDARNANVVPPGLPAAARRD
jgi:hypothetical protein